MNEVTLSMMLECREKRAKTQQELILMYGKPVVSFTMNIAGPVKTSYLIERGFSIGVERLLGSLLVAIYGKKAPVLEKKINFLPTGPEGFFVVDLDSHTLKEICTRIENQDALGRLFDIDVIDCQGQKLERSEERHCLLCDRPAKECSSRRLHTVEELWDKTNAILASAVLENDSNLVASLAVKSLLFEVLTTPKPGLVDRNNNGSHKDMDLFTFAESASVLFPYFQKAYCLGWNSVDAKTCFAQLRELGIAAEQAMFFETKGINTHKGAIFTLGILCCAAGFTALSKTDIFDCCSQMTSGITEELKDSSEALAQETNGKRLFSKYGLRGIRGEMEEGLPTVREIGLPMLEEYLQAGFSLEEAGARVLITLISQLSDTNMVARGGIEKANEAMKMACDLFSSDSFEISDIEKLDEYFISENLSPGGAADLLAVCYFLHFLKERFNGGSNE